MNNAQLSSAPLSTSTDLQYPTTTRRVPGAPRRALALCCRPILVAALRDNAAAWLLIREGEGHAAQMKQAGTARISNTQDEQEVCLA